VQDIGTPVGLDKLTRGGQGSRVCGPEPGDATDWLAAVGGHLRP